jgi:F0F1-type ATP synthase membrane subunit a
MASQRVGIISNWIGIFNESLYRTILSMVIQNMGRSNTVYFPLIYSLFF